MTAPAPQQQRNQDRIAAASAAAAAAVAAVRAGGTAASVSGSAARRAAALFGLGSTADVTRAAGVIVNGNAAATQAAVRVTSAAVETLWRTTDPYDDASVQAFAEQAGSLVLAAQRSVAATTSASQAILARAAGLRDPGAVQIPDDVRGAHVTFGADEVQVHPKPRVTVEYRPPAAGDKPSRVTVTAGDARPDRIFQRAAVTYRYEQSQGASPEAASRASVQRIGDIVDGNLTLAQRLAEQQTLRQAGATHYRRVIHPELSRGGTCGLCVAASDRIYRVADLKPIHLRCKCGVVPVAEGSDAGYELNKADFGMLYGEAGKLHGAGSSTAGVHLKRTRYDVVQHAELGPVLTRVRGEKVPYYSTALPPEPVDVGRPGRAAKSVPVKRASTQRAEEASADIAARHLPTLQATLRSLRQRGFAENSGPVQYHLAQIARLEKA